jgi:DNA-binding CsgD family transcriptional regulator
MLSKMFTNGARVETPLSRREREVLMRLAQGARGTELAEELGLSGETVRTHVRNAMGKLEARTRAQAVAIAVERGEISSQPNGR